ncbi:MAG: DEAD/DEAH box helicase [Actinomycetota bacterium]
MNPFAELGVAPQLVSALERQGIAEPFPIQAMTLLDSLAGRDVCGQARTGSGKTLAFSLPLAQRLKPGASDKPRGLVLVPTRELAVQVNAVLRPLAKAVGLRVVPVYGGVSMEPQKTAARRGVDIIVATPGRLIDLDRQGFVKLDEVEIAVIDEADRMADMGFLPQVEHLLRRFRDRRPQYMLFSATLDGQVGRLVRSYLNDPVRHEVAPEPQAEVEMTHRFLAVHHLDRVLVAAAIARSAERTLVFVRTKRGADRLARQLVREGVRTAAIHGDLRQSARERALKEFSDGKLQVLVATDVAARGIHVDEIDVVIHFDPPEDYKAYVHRSGRTARAGKGGIVATFVLWDQVLEVERLKRHLRLADPIIEVFSNDPRLANLTGLVPAVPTAS